MVFFDKISGIMLFLVFGGAFLYARSFPPRAAIFVYVINIFGMLLSAILVLASFIKDLKEKKDSAKKISREAWARMGITAGATISYAILLNIIGFVLGTAIYGTGMILYLYLGQRTKLYIIRILIISVSVALILYFIFGKMLYVMLP